MSNATQQFYDALKACQKDLKSFAYSLTRDYTDADDLVQDTMVKAIYFADRFEQGTNLKAWLNTILRNTFCNNYKKRVRRNAVFTVTDELPDHSLKTAALENGSADRFLAEDIRIALASIEQTYSIPFLRFFEGYKYHEIADELRVPIGTVKTRIHLARKLLKRELSMYSDQFASAG